MTMRRLFRSVIVAGVVAGNCVAGGAAFGEPLRKPRPFPVRAGTVSLLPVSYSDIRQDCVARKRPRIVVEKAPMRGALLVDALRLPYGTTKPSLAHCTGKPVLHTVLHYQARKGEKGFDDFTFVVIGSEGPVYRVTYRIRILPPR